MISSNSLGEILRYARKNANLTQAEVAEHLQVTTSEYSKIESGQRKKIYKHYLKILSAILHVEYRILLEKAGYTVDEDDDEYYDSQGKPLNLELLGKNIYTIDSDILKLLFETISTKKENLALVKKFLAISFTDENIELLDRILNLMNRNH